jgi:hypothetical protein
MSVDSEGQRLLNKLEYLEMLAANAVPSSYDAQAERVLAYASDVWLSVGLKPRKLRTTDIVGCYQHGARLMFHVKAFPRKRRETKLVIVSNPTNSEFLGHILIDLAAEYSAPSLICPSCDFEGDPDPEDLESLLVQIEPDDDDPFAIFETGDGTYIQTLCMDEGYVLEYQLVNTFSHYETPELVTFDEVVAAFSSYGFGGTEWLQSFEWQQQELP